MQKQLRIIIADDHPVVRIGVRQLLQAQGGFVIVGECSDGSDTLELVRRLYPDILLLDVAMPGLSGLEVLRQLRNEPGSTRTVLLTAGLERRELAEALQLGVRAVVTKDAAPRDLVEAILAVADDQYWIGQRSVGSLVDMLQQRGRIEMSGQSFGLTARELQIISTVVVGCTNRDIAESLSISEDTVKRHLTHIFDKVGVSNRLELGLFAVHHHLVNF
jgi:DNA-binding NarL/FixJ family response regulator